MISLSSIGAGGRALWRRYEGALAKQPILVQATTSAILWGAGDYIAQKGVERRAEIDGRRVAITSLFGACFMGPVGHCWYLGLDTVATRLLKPGSPGFVAAKVIADTVILGPIYVLAFYAWGSCLIDGTGWEGFRTKITKDFAATYLAELAIWPAFQTFNFNRIPVDHQLLAVNLMTLVDASFLSYARGQDDWVASIQALILGKTEQHDGKVAQ